MAGFAGVASAFKALQPRCRIYGVEPGVRIPCTGASPPARRKDVTIRNDRRQPRPPYALPYSFGLCRRFVDRLVLVNDEQIIDAMAVLFREMKLAVEPAGAAATAALFGPLREELRGRRVGLIVCGSNIDIDSFARYTTRGIERSGRL